MASRRSLAPILAAALVVPLSATAAAPPTQTFLADYSVSFLGFTVARSTFVSTVGAERYSVDGSIKSAGLASFFSKLSAKTSVSGHIDQGRFAPDSYLVDYVYGKKVKKTELQFAKGKVVKVSNQPAPPPRRPDWVPVDAKALLAVLDPVSATLIRAKDPKSVCSRTLKAFDGEIRADMVLSYVNTAPITIGDFKGEAVTCMGRFKPVAGYHPSNKSLKYLSSKSRIVMKFAEIGESGVYAPIQASVGTKVGTVSIRARKLDIK
jgi:hypothetical protein